MSLSTELERGDGRPLKNQSCRFVRAECDREPIDHLISPACQDTVIIKFPKPDPFCVLLTMAEATLVMMLSEEAGSGELVDQGQPILTACDVKGINNQF